MEMVAMDVNDEAWVRAGAAAIQDEMRLPLIDEKKTSAASCFTREDRQWTAVRLTQSAHY
jgi:hypothetical protein